MSEVKHKDPASVATLALGPHPRLRISALGEGGRVVGDCGCASTLNASVTLEVPDGEGGTLFVALCLWVHNGNQEVEVAAARSLEALGAQIGPADSVQLEGGGPDGPRYARARSNAVRAIGRAREKKAKGAGPKGVRS